MCVPPVVMPPRVMLSLIGGETTFPFGSGVLTPNTDEFVIFRALHSRWTIRVLFALMISSCCFLSARSLLTVDEIAAMTLLWDRFPDLREVPAWATTSDDGQNFGASWTRDFDKACASAGYHFYGLHCSSAGHIDGLNITDLWGYPLDSTPLALSGLSFVRNITNTANRTGDIVVEGVVGSVPVEHVNWPTGTFDPWQFSNPHSIVSLNVFYASTDSLGPLSSLRSLTQWSPYVDTKYHFVSNMIEEIVLHSFVNPMHVLDELANMPNLKVFRCGRCDETFVPNNYNVSSSSLVELELGLYRPVSGWTPNVLSFNSSTLRQLTVGISYGRISVTRAPNLISFTTDNYVVGMDSLIHLQSFNASVTWVLPPSLPSNGELRSVVLHHVGLNASELSTYLCWVAGSPVLQKLRVEASSSLRTIYNFPACMSSLSTLESVELIGLKFNTTSVLDNMPRTVKSLKLVNALEDLISPEMIRFYFGGLERLYAEGVLTWRFELTFFQTMPNLEMIEISGQMGGPIPTKGWENLKSVRLTGPFSSWPALTGTATKLEELYINAPPLTSFPTDQMFAEANLTSLRTFEVTSRYLGGPVPEFWVNLPQLTSVIWMANFSGHYPQKIGAPRLQILMDSSYFGAMCGPLPQFTVPTYLKIFSIGGGRVGGFSQGEQLYLTGPFTGANLTVLHRFVLDYADLSGTIPSDFFNHHAVQRQDIFLRNVFVPGGMWNMSRGANLLRLSIKDSNIDICSSTATPSGSIGYCNFDLVPNCTSSCPSTWSLCGTYQSCNATAPLPPTPPQCIQPPPRIAPPGFAPPPPPPQLPSAAPHRDIPIFFIVVIGLLQMIPLLFSE